MGKALVMVGLTRWGGRLSVWRGGPLPCLALGAVQFFPAARSEPFADVNEFVTAEFDAYSQQVRLPWAWATVQRDAG
ncbi:hypothetical protein ACVCAG_29985 [Streptosporangium sp. G12]